MRPLGFNAVTASLAIVQSSGFLASPPMAKSRSGLDCEAALHESRGRSCGDDTGAQPAKLCLRTIEFYSGIGGLRLALEAAVEDAGVRSDCKCHTTFVDCYEINMVANSVRGRQYYCMLVRMILEKVHTSSYTPVRVP